MFAPLAALGFALLLFMIATGIGSLRPPAMLILGGTLVILTGVIWGCRGEAVGGRYRRPVW